MATGLSAVRSGIVMFVIPFVFAFYPELLLIEEAVIDPASATSVGVAYLPGYDNTIHWPTFIVLIGRLILALYLTASALARFDAKTLGLGEVSIRLVLAILIMMANPAVFLPAVAAALLVIGWHKYNNRGEAAL